LIFPESNLFRAWFFLPPLVNWIFHALYKLSPLQKSKSCVKILYTGVVVIRNTVLSSISFHFAFINYIMSFTSRVKFFSVLVINLNDWWVGIYLQRGNLF